MVNKPGNTSRVFDYCAKTAPKFVIDKALITCSFKHNNEGMIMPGKGGLKVKLVT